MFGLGIWEFVLVVLVALLVLGPEKLPTVARQIGRGLRELRRAANDLQTSLEEATRPDEHAGPSRLALRSRRGARPDEEEQRRGHPRVDPAEIEPSGTAGSPPPQVADGSARQSSSRTADSEPSSEPPARERADD